MFGDHPTWGLRRIGLQGRDLLVLLRQVRRSGYAVRPRQYRGETAMADTLSVITCPVVRHGGAIGALAMLWPKGLLSPAGFADAHLARLKETTANISADLRPLARRLSVLASTFLG